MIQAKVLMLMAKGSPEKLEMMKDTVDFDFAANVCVQGAALLSRGKAHEDLP